MLMRVPATMRRLAVALAVGIVVAALVAAAAAQRADWSRYNDEGMKAYKAGRYREAEDLLEKAIQAAVDTRNVGGAAASMRNLAVLKKSQGRYEAAEAIYKEILELFEKAAGRDHPLVGETLLGLADTYARAGRDLDAQVQLERAVPLMEKGSPPEELAEGLSQLGRLYARTGKLTEASALHTRALAMREKIFGREHPKVADSLGGLAWVEVERGRFAEAEAYARRALALREKALGPNDPDVAEMIFSLANIQSRAGQHAAAAAGYQRALGMIERAYGPDHVLIATILEQYAPALRALNRPADAAVAEARAKLIRDR